MKCSVNDIIKDVWEYITVGMGMWEKTCLILGIAINLLLLTSVLIELV